MAEKRNMAFLLKMSANTAPPTYHTVAGMRVLSQSISGEPVTVPQEASGWRELLASARSVSIKASGIFLSAIGEARIRERALAGLLDDYELSFENGEKLRGRFLILRLDYLGDFNGERNYELQLESSGGVTLA